ncbi:MAG: hypothetical protein LQ341_005121, partial [Variospora aurantia]
RASSNNSLANAPNDKRNYLFHVSNLPTSDPKIQRTLSVPPTLTFGKLHEVLQVATSWMDSHMHVFTIETILALNADRAQINDEGMGVNPGYRTEDEKKWTLQDVFEKQTWGDLRRFYQSRTFGLT